MNPPQPPSEYTRKEAMLYCMGAIGLQIISIPFVQFIVKFYSPSPDSGNPIYMPLGFATFIMTLGVINDAVSDPLIGWWSDRSRSPMGRRRPFIIFGCIPLLIAFVMMWYPIIGVTSHLNFLWGVFWGSIYYWAFTIAVVPYFALLPEIARTDSSRTTLAIWHSVGMVLGLFVGFSAGLVIELLQNAGHSYVRAYQIAMTAYCLLGVSLLATTGIFIKERFVIDRELSLHEEESSLKSVFTDLFTTLRNKPFLIFMAAIVIFNIGWFTIQLVLPYFTHVMLHKGDDFVTFLTAPLLVVCILFYGVIFALKEKVNKKYFLLFALLFLALLFPFFTVIGLIQSIATRTIMAFGIFALAGIPQAILYVIQQPILGEIIDYDETYTGRRREAIYAGALGFSMKAGTSISAPIMGKVFDKFGYTRARPQGLMVIGPVTAVIALIGFVVFLFYPINVAKLARGDEGRETQ